MRKAQIYIKNHWKKNYTEWQGGVVFQLGVFTPPP